MNTNTLHAHMTRESSDCDGSYSRTYLVRVSPEEIADDFGDIAFHERVVGSMVSFAGFGGSLTVATEGFTEATWHETTEEGGIRLHAAFCDDSSCHDESTQRDHRAEAAGY